MNRCIVRFVLLSFLCLQALPINAAHLARKAATTKKFNYQKARTKDPVAQLIKNIKSAKLSSTKPGDFISLHARFYDDKGQTPLHVAIRKKNPTLRKQIIHELLLAQASPAMPDLKTLKTPAQKSPEIQQKIEATKNIDGLSTNPILNLITLHQLYASLQLFFKADSAEQIKLAEDIYKKMLKESDENAARQILHEYLHNGIAVTHFVLAPFFDESLVSPNIKKQLKERFECQDPLFFYARILVMSKQMGDQGEHESEADFIERATKTAEILAPQFIKNTGKLVAALINHPEIELFKNNLAMAQLLQDRYFEGKLPFAKAHYAAQRSVQRALEKKRDQEFVRQVFGSL